MDFVGKTVKKEGFCYGTVRSYNPASGLFEIVYEDGESEQRELGGLVELIGERDVVKPRVCRKPKKRRRIERRNSGVEGSGVELEGSSIRNVDLDDGFMDSFRESDKPDVNLSGDVDLNRVCDETLDRECGGADVDLNGEREGNLRNEIDLNAGFDLNLNLNYEFDSGDLVTVNIDYEETFNKRRRGYIDLNVDANCIVDAVVGSGSDVEKRVHGFDLNLEVDEESVKDDMDMDVQVNGPNSSDAVQETSKVEGKCSEENIANGELKEVHVAEVSCLRLLDEIRKQNSVSGLECQVYDSDGVSAEPDTTAANVSQYDMGKSYERRRGRRKRRKLLDNLNNCITETVLRRSSRRTCSQNHIATATMSCLVDELSPSPAVSGLTEEKAVITGGKGICEAFILPPKLELPPSSRNLNLDGFPLLDVFSIYACLRSFSTLLFLSPFELENFVEALNSESPSSLFDCIHVSILQTLRKHLEQLSAEGDEATSDCLRSLNWDFLDVITWPLFMVEYLLFHGSGLNLGLDLSRLKLFRNEYYKQPVTVKVEILRYLCDNMIEVEAIRSELNRRTLASEHEMGFDRNVKVVVGRKRRSATETTDNVYLKDDGNEDSADWNSDECCLCKMDGSLLCCDGCPAAYHSKCVGVASHLLPEGDWYCPECLLDQGRPGAKPRKSLRGADLLGTDPHGRQYFSSCGYLLVLDANVSESSFHYYHMNDLNRIVDVLKSSGTFYGRITKAICQKWEVPVCLNRSTSNMNSQISVDLNDVAKEQIPSLSMSRAAVIAAEACVVESQTVNEGRMEEKSVTGNSNHPCVKKSGNLSDSVTAMEVPYLSSEGSAETVQTGSSDQSFPKQVSDPSNRSAELLNHHQAPGDSPLPGSCSLAYNGSDILRESVSMINTIAGSKPHLQCGTGYRNCYSFARTISQIAEEMMRKSSNSTNELKSEEDIVSMQVKTILMHTNKFHWQTIQSLNLDAWKENCGWCFSCKTPADEAADDSGCLFNMRLGPLQGLPKNEIADLHSKNKKGHLIDVKCQIISIENRLQGLLLGPWLDPHYHDFWRESVLKASNISSLKRLLLKLEANLHHRALSPEWLKHVDSAVTMGSASNIVIASMRACSKNGLGKKRGRLSESEVDTTAKKDGLSMRWWRGGQLSRQMFNWKVLPWPLVAKAARQAGSMKIPGILYPENSDSPRRSRCVTWRAAVESSTSMEQLGMQVRELDSNIKWDDIENSHLFPALDKEARKSIRLFKKTIVRRKSSEGDSVKYLLDFGKRRNIPDVVLRNGSMVEESSSGRKRYWLNESYVPLHLLKGFEEKRIARKSGKPGSKRLSEAFKTMKRSSKERGFSYLFARAERSEFYRCGNCKEDVLVREAVWCHNCKGFFHKRHIRKSGGASTRECMYTRHRCQDGMLVTGKRKIVKIGKRRGRKPKSFGLQTQKHKKVTPARKSTRLKNIKTSVTEGKPLRLRNDKKVVANLPLRRSARTAQKVSHQNKNRILGGYKKRKGRPKKGMSKKSKKVTSWRKKRTKTYYSYWSNGLLLSRKPSDERVMLFRRDRYVALSKHSPSDHDQPKCGLCPVAGSTSGSSYIACEICGEWFHGDAYGLDDENIGKLIGFRCHGCRKRLPPICPHAQSITEAAEASKMLCSLSV